MNNYWKQYKKGKIGLLALALLTLFFLIGLYAPLLASNKPLLLTWKGSLYSPLIRYLFYPGFYTKPIDLFFNILMFTLPVVLFAIWLKKWRFPFLTAMVVVQCLIFALLQFGYVKDPAADAGLMKERQNVLAAKTLYRDDPLLSPLKTEPTWDFDLKFMTTYAKLNLLMRNKLYYDRHHHLAQYAAQHLQTTGREAPTQWKLEQRNQEQTRSRLNQVLSNTLSAYEKGVDELPALMAAYHPFSHAYIMAKYHLENAPPAQRQEAQATYERVLLESATVRTPLLQTRNKMESYQSAVATLAYMDAKERWIQNESENFHILIPPLLRSFHWEEDAGGSQAFNSYLPWWELTRVNRKDLLSSLIFGMRTCAVVGLTTVALALLIGIPLGMVAGYFAGKWDLLTCRLIEVWEAMPTFFMLLLVVAISQTKSIFMLIAVLGFFGWTTFARFIRAEFLKQRELPYVLACKSIGYPNRRIMFSHILPNAIPPILTLLPFSVMAAISSEAGISFLGLGEEGSTSWGVLMNEGRSVFPGESYLLWPPAILLTLLLVSIAIVGDALRDAIDPKMR